jgi:hypothetical protein
VGPLHTSLITTLHRRLKALPWRDAYLSDRTDEHGHGRREIRRMKICTVRPGLAFPHAAQALQVKRRRTGPVPPHEPWRACATWPSAWPV